MKASYSGSDNYAILEEIIEENNLDGLDVLRMFCTWHGLQLLTRDFTEEVMERHGIDIE